MCLIKCVHFLLFFSSDTLVDIDVPGKIQFQESETLTPGCELAKFKNGYTHAPQY